MMMRICCAAVLALGLAACGSKTVAPTTPAPVTVTQADPAASMAAQQAALAAGAAKMASDDAAEAVAAVEASQAADMPSYTDAQDAAAAALAAQAASDAAGVATTTADAQEQRDIAQTKQGEAETALADARNFAGAVEMAQQAIDDAAAQAIEDAAIEAMNLSDAKTAAMTAATDARTAADDAAAAVAAVDVSQAADMPSYTDAQDAAAAALAASMAAQAASDAAATATTAAAAQEQRDIALAKQAEAETALADARDFAGVVRMAQQDIDDAAAQAIEDAAIEAMNLSDAKTAAMTAATDARTAADDAQAAADTVADLTGDGSAQAMAAQAAADAAATAAEEASARAQAATMSADAVGEQTTAETEQVNADDQLEIAQELQRESQVASAAAGQVQQGRDIDDAKEMAKAAAAAALDHFNSADQKSKDARAKAVEARDAADRAVRARTDFVVADKQATAAETAATEAEMARADAWTAVAAADAASMSAVDATTLADAQMYQEAADAAKDAAEEQATGAGMNYMTAMDAAAAAETAAGTHVLGLFMSANAYDVKDDDDNEAEVASVGAAIAAAAMATDGDQAGEATATAAWAVDTPDDRGTADVDEAMPGLLKITFDSMVTDGTDMIESDTVGDADADPAVKPNAKPTNGIGDFPHGFDMSSEGARVLVFTDKEQETPAVVAVTAVTVVNAAVEVGAIESVGEFSDAETSFPGSFDHDDQDNTPAIKGTFTCATSPCSLVYTGSGDDVMVTTATGYTFSGRREGVTAVEAAAKADYLLFGVWLDETDAGADTFGAIATGGQPFTENNVQALEGKATYRGPAVGAHHKTGSGVSSFDGDANLAADFKDANTAGTIEGTIDNISVDGGDPMEEPIHLVKIDLTNANTFNGKAVMGEQLGPGLDIHTFNGTWSGGFFGNGEKMTDHPGSVAGTFGVTNTTGSGDDAVTESYVGAFGAHKQ